VGRVGGGRSLKGEGGYGRWGQVIPRTRGDAGASNSGDKGGGGWMGHGDEGGGKGMDMGGGIDVTSATWAGWEVGGTQHRILNTQKPVPNTQYPAPKTQ